MSVRRVYESPRVTRPFSSEQWAAIDLLGETVDQTMARLGVGLTMGGEPTFVSMEDRDGPAWHTEALGEGKYNLAFKLFARQALCKHRSTTWARASGTPANPCPAGRWTATGRRTARPSGANHAGWPIPARLPDGRGGCAGLRAEPRRAAQ